MARVAPARTEPWHSVQSAALGIGMQVPASLDARVNAADHLLLIRPAASAADFEAVHITRYRDRNGDTAEGWQRALTRMATDGQWRDILVAPLQRYPVADCDGTLGLLRFTDGAGVGTVAALWCGQAGSDTVTLLYRCGLDREALFSATVSALLHSLTVMPRGGTERRDAPPAVVFGVGLAIAVALIVIGMVLRAG